MHTILFLRPHIFRFFLLGRMPSGSLTKHICPNLGFWICSNNLNLPFAESFVELMPKNLHGNIGSQLFSCYCIVTIGMIEYQGAVLAVSNKPYSHYPHGSSKDLRLCVKLLTWLRLICIITKSLVCNCKAIRGHLNPQRNQIKAGCFSTNGKMVNDGKNNNKDDKLVCFSTMQ